MYTYAYAPWNPKNRICFHRSRLKRYFSVFTGLVRLNPGSYKPKDGLLTDVKSEKKTHMGVHWGFINNIQYLKISEGILQANFVPESIKLFFVPIK